MVHRLNVIYVIFFKILCTEKYSSHLIFESVIQKKVDIFIGAQSSNSMAVRHVGDRQNQPAFRSVENKPV